jgi:hypothetical protein
MLRERANEVAEDLELLLRRYENVVNERMRLKLLPAVSSEKYSGLPCG